MKYLLVTDLHGEMDTLMGVLSSRGWEDMYHPDETLIVMGDSVDRGEDSLKTIATLVQSPSVVHLMGNHDIKIIRGRPGYPTGEQMEADPKTAAMVRNAVMDFPYTFVGKGFVAAHAYPFGSQQEAIYGLTEPSDNEYGRIRLPWWEEYTLRPYATFFGHYHAEMDMMWPEKRLYCLDNHDAGVFTYAVIENGVEEIITL